MEYTHAGRSGGLNVIVNIEDPTLIERILTHLGLIDG